MARKARYTAQMSFTCLPEHKQFVEDEAARLEVSQADVARDLFDAGIQARAEGPRHVSDEAAPVSYSSPVVG